MCGGRRKIKKTSKYCRDLNVVNNNRWDNSFTCVLLILNIFSNQHVSVGSTVRIKKVTFKRKKDGNSLFDGNHL